ncbi:hypothetical protein AGLY_012971 [Aphis glycines]|uniref:Uncharacterized protein n=1 Tax=Aphis glycines TaxID=307491 RepID=A0A6G0T7Q0_APHGL|nr:hypothetical protein AGLY_012971 [Aphis glycines]
MAILDNLGMGYTTTLKDFKIPVVSMSNSCRLQTNWKRLLIKTDSVHRPYFLNYEYCSKKYGVVELRILLMERFVHCPSISIDLQIDLFMLLLRILSPEDIVYSLTYNVHEIIIAYSRIGANSDTKRIFSSKLELCSTNKFKKSFPKLTFMELHKGFLALEQSSGFCSCHSLFLIIILPLRSYYSDLLVETVVSVRYLYK